MNGFVLSNVQGRLGYSVSFASSITCNGRVALASQVGAFDCFKVSSRLGTLDIDSHTFSISRTVSFLETAFFSTNVPLE